MLKQINFEFWGSKCNCILLNSFKWGLNCVFERSFEMGEYKSLIHSFVQLERVVNFKRGVGVGKCFKVYLRCIFLPLNSRNLIRFIEQMTFLSYYRWENRKKCPNLSTTTFISLSYSLYLSLTLSIYLLISLSIYLFIYLFVYLSIYLSLSLFFSLA